MTEVSAAQAERRAALATTFTVAGARRLTEHEIGLLLQEIRWWLSTHPNHDAGLHSGPSKADDTMQTYCWICNAINHLDAADARIQAGA